MRRAFQVVTLLAGVGALLLATLNVWPLAFLAGAVTMGALSLWITEQHTR